MLPQPLFFCRALGPCLGLLAARAMKGLLLHRRAIVIFTGEEKGEKTLAWDFEASTRVWYDAE